MKAPNNIPSDQLGEFTMGGLIPVENRYRNDCSDEVQKEINDNFNQEVFDKYLLMARNQQENYYGWTDKWLYECLEHYPVKGKTLCIFGSANPWYEAVALTYGAKKIVVVEYSNRPSFHPSVEYITPDQSELLSEKYDIGWSISSFEHDGLGRYGDPLCGDGDFKAMKRAKTKTNLLVLSVPVGQDKICFNVHRIYGSIRFPYLIDGWNPLQTFGFYEDSFQNTSNGIHGTPYQPIIVLHNQ